MINILHILLTIGYYDPCFAYVLANLIDLYSFKILTIVKLYEIHLLIKKIHFEVATDGLM